MGAQPSSRAGIVFVAVGVAVFGLFALVFFWGAGIACEDAASEDFNTVRCATEGADGWKTFQVVLLCAAAAALVGGTVWSLAKRRMTGVAIGATALIAAFIAVFAINYKDVGSATTTEEPTKKAPPGVTDFELIDAQCQAPCTNGFRVSVTTNFKAELHVDIAPRGGSKVAGREYTTLIDGKQAGDGFESEGRDVFNVSGEFVGPPPESGPLPPGDYFITVSARPRDGEYRADVPINAQAKIVTIVP